MRLLRMAGSQTTKVLYAKLWDLTFVWKFWGPAEGFQADKCLDQICVSERLLWKSYGRQMPRKGVEVGLE